MNYHRLYALAGVSGWRIISREPNRVQGVLTSVESLLGVQQENYSQPTILITDTVRGEEEIPMGVVGVIVTGGCPDVLCHAAVRARSSRVPLVCCNDQGGIADIQGMVGVNVRIEIKGEDVTVSPGDVHQKEGVSGSNEKGESESSEQDLQYGPADGQVHKPQQQGDVNQRDTSHAHPHDAAASSWCGSYVLAESDFSSMKDHLGGKSLNTVQMLGKLPPWIRQPWSMALPFGTFESVLQEAMNAEVCKQITTWRQDMQKVMGQDGTAMGTWDSTTLHNIRYPFHSTAISSFQLLHRAAHKIASCFKHAPGMVVL